MKLKQRVVVKTKYEAKWLAYTKPFSLVRHSDDAMNWSLHMVHIVKPGRHDIYDVILVTLKPAYTEHSREIKHHICS